MLLGPGLRAATTNLFTFPTLYTAAVPRASSSSSSFSIFRRLSSLSSRTTRTYTKTLPLPRRSSPLLLVTTTTLALSGGFLGPSYFAYPTRNDVSPYSHGRDAKNPLSTDGGRSLNPAAIRQVSTGAILGLGLGVLFSALSRMLVLVLGVGIVVWQYAARRGYNFIPVDRMQKYIKGVNLRSAINDNAAFKISFGLMFALTAFGEF